MRIDCYGGPEDGRTVTVPPECKELRFPVAPSFRMTTLEDSRMEPAPMPVSVYYRHWRPDGVPVFVYQGQR